MKKLSISFLAVGVLFLIYGLIAPVAVAFINPPDATAVGIIGGADSSVTEELAFLFWSRSHRFLLTLFGAAFLITGTVSLIFKRAILANCSKKASLMSLGLSLASSAGLCCIFVWMIAVGMDNMGQYPIEHTLSVLGGVLCLLVCVVLLLFYIMDCLKTRKYKRIFFDIGIVLVYFPAFFFAWTEIYNILV